MQKPTKLQRFFFFTYAAFLLPSIPHIASYFLAFEGNVQGYELWFWVVVSYLIAIAIDGTLLWLTHTVARDTAHKAGYRAIIWTFILFLVAFSGFLNWHIAKHNAPLASQQLSGAFIPDVDPIVASLFPVLAIMYAVMSRHVFADTKTDNQMNIEELEAEAEIAERKATALARINAASDQQKTSWLKGKIGIVQNALKNDSGESKELPLEDKKAVNELPENEGLPESKEQNVSQDSNQENEALPKAKIEAKPEIPIEIVEPEPAPQTQFSEEVLRLLNLYPEIQLWLTTGQKTAMLEEIISVTHHSKKMLTNRLNDGTLKRTPRNQNLILISSVIEWLKVAPNPSQNGHDTTPLELVNLS